MYKSRHSYKSSCIHRRLLSTRVSSILSSLRLSTAKGAEVSGVYTGKGEWRGTGPTLESVCPTTGEVLARVTTASPEETSHAVKRAREGFKTFRTIPAPRRGEIIRQIRAALSAHKSQLGALVSLEMGKIRSEGEGEVQEFLDICDYAIGLSRSMAGRVIKSERPGHTILEVANPLGVVGILSAFNFPVAVYGWNLALSLACGNATIWKPAPTTPLCAVAVTKLIAEVLERNGVDGAVAGLVCGGREVGEPLVTDRGVDMVSFTGSEAVGQQVGVKVQERFGKVLLELGGNNAAIVAPSASIPLALRTLLFSAAGTCGQRCTTTRRLFLHRSHVSTFLAQLVSAYASLSTRIGDPLEPRTLLGPLHTAGAVDRFLSAIEAVRAEGGEVLCGGTRQPHLLEGNFVLPCIVRPASLDSPVFEEEVFGPLLSVAVYDELEEAIEWNNRVRQGLSSTLFTRDLGEVGRWIGEEGSDCGIVNVNVATSGAEIGAAFGGNKHTGWGRESGGDAWKQYVRWSACTVNFSEEAPLAQGVSFE